MSGGGSKSTSKPTYTPQQIKVFEWMQQNIVPLAEGKETYLTQLMAQRARDEAAKLQGQQEQGLQNMAGVTGMSAGQVGQSLQSQQQSAIQATLAQIMNQRMAMQQQALNMIGNIPMAPGQTSTERGANPWIQALGSAAGGAAGGVGGGIGAALGKKLWPETGTTGTSGTSGSSGTGSSGAGGAGGAGGGGGGK